MNNVRKPQPVPARSWLWGVGLAALLGIALGVWWQRGGSARGFRQGMRSVETVEAWLRMPRPRATQFTPAGQALGLRRGFGFGRAPRRRQAYRFPEAFWQGVDAADRHLTISKDAPRKPRVNTERDRIEPAEQLASPQAVTEPVWHMLGVAVELTRWAVAEGDGTAIPFPLWRGVRRAMAAGRITPEPWQRILELIQLAEIEQAQYGVISGRLREVLANELNALVGA